MHFSLFHLLCFKTFLHAATGIDQWAVRTPPCPQQKKDDCGVYMLSNLRYRSRKEDVFGASGPGKRGGKGVVEGLRERIAREIETNTLAEWM